MEQLRKLVAALTLKQRITVVLMAIAAAALVGGLVHWKHESDFKPLFTGMAPEDASTIVAKLKESSTEYRLADNGGTVLVPGARLDELRLEMAGAGLPKTGRIGFELFDKTNLGITDFTEHVNFRRALEGELERSVRALSEVQDARVHVTFPRDSVFLESREPAKASVLVHLRLGAHLSAANVNAITHLVASAVEGLNPDSVSVLDMSGNLLSRPHRSPIDGGEPTEGALEYRQQVEKDLLAKMNSTLEPLLGDGKFRAGVSVDCDFTSGEQSDEIFDPSRSVMVTSQKTEDLAGNSAGRSAGVPGTASNLPRPTSRPTSSGSNMARRTENVTYETSRMVRHTKMPQGAIKRISASLLLDQDVRWQGKQKILVPPTPEKLKAIHDLVAGAIGLSTDRGDQLVIESLPFEQTLVSEPPAPPAPAPAPQKNWLLTVDRRILIGAGVALLLILVAGGLLMRRGGKGREAAVVTVPAAIGSPVAQALVTNVDAAAEREQITKAAEENVQQQLKMQNDQKQKYLAEMQEKLRLPPLTTKKVEVLRQHLKDMVKTDSALAAGVLRGWLEEDSK
ncbi:MAG TPA: flagellar basal-body MS-ring/collar protein FliF [Bryobacteraceae bacterium]|nr:flagellar basal-body MS-ring/collar protein FliF [Bryobacteraceae bacterium]